MTAPTNAFAAWAAGVIERRRLTPYEEDRLPRIGGGLQRQWRELRATTAIRQGCASPVDWGPDTAKIHFHGLISLYFFATDAGYAVDDVADLLGADVLNAVFDRMDGRWEPQSQVMALNSLRTIAGILGIQVPKKLAWKIGSLRRQPRLDKWDRVLDPAMLGKGAFLLIRIAEFGDAALRTVAALARRAAVIALQANAAARLGELLGLGIGDIRPDGRGNLRVFIGEQDSKAKRAQIRTIWDPNAIEVIRRYLEIFRPILAARHPGPPADSLWLSLRGKPAGEATLDKDIRKATAMIAGVPSSTNLLRRGRVAAARNASERNKVIGNRPNSAVAATIYASRLGAPESLRLQERFRALAEAGGDSQKNR